MHCVLVVRCDEMMKITFAVYFFIFYYAKQKYCKSLIKQKPRTHEAPIFSTLKYTSNAFLLYMIIFILFFFSAYFALQVDA